MPLSTGSNFIDAVDVLTVVGNPTINTVNPASPSSAYVGSTITVTGSNFINGSQTCSAAKIGSAPASGADALSCTIVSSTRITVVVGSNTALGAAGIYFAMSNPSSATFASANNVLTVTASECFGTWSTAALSVGREYSSATSLPAQGLVIFAGGRPSSLLLLFQG